MRARNVERSHILTVTTITRTTHSYSPPSAINATITISVEQPKRQRQRQRQRPGSSRGTESEKENKPTCNHSGLVYMWYIGRVLIFSMHRPDHEVVVVCEYSVHESLHCCFFSFFLCIRWRDLISVSPVFPTRPTPYPHRCTTFPTPFIYVTGALTYLIWNEFLRLLLFTFSFAFR